MGGGEQKGKEKREQVMNIRGSPNAHLRFIPFRLKENIMEE